MSKSILLLSGHYPASHWQAQTNHKIFASRNGFDYRHNSHCTPSTTPYLHKLHWLEEEISRYDFVFWIDDDSFFLGADGEIIRELCESQFGFFLRGREEEAGVAIPPINTCFFGLRNRPENADLLRTAISITSEELQKEWDARDGHSYGGDQDRIWLALKRRFGKEFPTESEFDLIGNLRLNGRYQDLVNQHRKKEPPLILHLTGKTNRKWCKLRTIEKINLYGSNLIGTENLENYPLAKSKHHRIIASRLADHPKLEPIAKLMPKKLARAIGVYRAS